MMSLLWLRFGHRIGLGHEMTTIGRRRRSRNVIALALATACLQTGMILAAPPVLAGETSAVILQYHRFGDSRQPAINIRLSQFEAHIEELRKSRYTVLPVSRIVEMLRRGEPMPERTIGITIDGSYASVYHEAWPRLQEADLPFIMFVNTDRVDRLAPDNMTWDQIREMQEAGVEIGNHTRSRAHLLDMPPDRVKRELEGADIRITSELGITPTLFSYPYGEFDLPTRRLVGDHGFNAGFAQFSGAVGVTTDHLVLPRFAMNEQYGDIDRFRLILNALALPVSDFNPPEHVVTDNPPQPRFRVGPEVDEIETLACFASGFGALDITVKNRDVTVAFPGPLPEGRTRLTCTMRGHDDRWRWFGRQFMVQP